MDASDHIPRASAMFSDRANSREPEGACALATKPDLRYLRGSLTRFFWVRRD